LERPETNIVSCRNTPEIDRNGSSIPGQNIADFSAEFRPFPTGKSKDLTERHRKKPKYSGQEYCFHEISGISWIRAFPCRIVRPE
jgi:hypothetical protein